MLNVRIIIVFYAVLFFCSLPTAAQDDNFFYIVNAQNLEGITGNITTPSPYTVPDDKIVFGLHKFKISITYGISAFWEMGMNFDLRQFSSLVTQAAGTDDSLGFQTKYQMLKQYPYGSPLDISMGLNNRTYYIVAGRQFERFLDTVIQAGVDYFDEDTGYFMSLSRPVNYSCFIIDYHSRTDETNIGWRVLLAPDVKLDIFFTNITRLNNLLTSFVFGLTLVS